ncbi:type II toxin-antitoxin system Phd/YefM family antitoxin [Cephaloticoccus primus]|nr:type II toxin-antitoxin system prevent-host-death family antitoxin [Cephaloticoccus primus]
MDSAPINIQAAKAQFSRLIAEVTEGKEIVLAKAGKPVAKLVPYSPPLTP